MTTRKTKGAIYPLEKGKPRSKCRKWKLIVPIGKDATGKRRQKNRNFTGTFTQAQRALEVFVQEIDCGDVVAKSTHTFNTYMEHFIETRKMSGEVAEGTIRREKEKLSSIAFLIGEVKLQDITPEVLEKAYLDLRSGKSKSGKKLSGTYVNDISKKVSLMMDHAKKNGIVTENPCKMADRPKIDTAEKRSLDDAKVQSLVDALNPVEHMQCAVLLCTTLGLRRGEVVGLSWEDVDFAARTVHVCHSYDDAGNMNTPKTKAGDRYLPLPDIAYDALRKRYASQVALFTSFANELLEMEGETVKGIVEGTPVICDQYGTRIHPAGLGHWWYKRRADYGLEGYTLHNLRHTFLSMAARRGVHPSVMQKLAGHSTARITMEIYTHANMDAQREAMDAMQKAFTQKKEKTPDKDENAA